MNSYKRALYSSLIRIGANIVMVGAVFVAMYQAARWPGWPSEAVFCLLFFGITSPAWILAWLLTKKTRAAFPDLSTSMVPLPGRGRQMVRWRVREPEAHRFVLAR